MVIDSILIHKLEPRLLPPKMKLLQLNDTIERDITSFSSSFIS